MTVKGIKKLTDERLVAKFGELCGELMCALNDNEKLSMTDMILHQQLRKEIKSRMAK